jgi:hypothetical protein
MPQQRRYEDHAARQRAYRVRQARARCDEQQAQGLPPAPALPTMPSQARWQALISRARLAVETARDEMQAYYDDRSDAWQQSDRASMLAEQIDLLSTALDDLEALPTGYAHQEHTKRPHGARKRKEDGESAGNENVAVPAGGTARCRSPHGCPQLPATSPDGPSLPR